MLFHWTTKCQEDTPTGENFLPPIKTRSPLVKAVDGLQAGKITFKDYYLICWVKVGFTHFLTTNKIFISDIACLQGINLTKGRLKKKNSKKSDIVTKGR